MAPAKKATDTPLLKEYVYCRDLDGERWTVPRGSKLHLDLWADVQQGYPEPFVPVELIREPWRGLQWEPADALPAALQLAETQSERMKLYRLGQFLRLQQRRKVASNG